MSEQQLRRQIQSLTDKLATMGGRPKSKKKNTVQNASQPSVSGIGTKSGKKSKRKGSASNLSSGQITLERKEILVELKSTGVNFQATSIKLRPESFSFLKKFTMFDRFRFNRLRLYYKPMVASTQSGSVIYGVEWDMSTNTPKSRADLSSLSPVRTHACWFDGESQPLICPAPRLHTKLWFSVDAADKSDDSGPGVLLVGFSGPSEAITLGEIWADYSVTLMGSTF